MSIPVKQKIVRGEDSKLKVVPAPITPTISHD